VNEKQRHMRGTSTHVYFVGASCTPGAYKARKALNSTHQVCGIVMGHKGSNQGPSIRCDDAHLLYSKRMVSHTVSQKETYKKGRNDFCKRVHDMRSFQRHESGV
jgi:hypothetical protein